MRHSVLVSAVAMQAGVFLCGCGISGQDDAGCRHAREIIAYVAHAENAINDSQTTLQFSDALAAIQDRAVKSRLLREYALAIQARLPRMKRLRGYLAGADPNFWLAMNCCDEMRKNGFRATECLEVPFFFLKAVCDELLLVESGAKLAGEGWSEKERSAHLRGLAMLACQWIEALDTLALRGNAWAIPPDEKSKFFKRLSGYSTIVQHALKAQPERDVPSQGTAMPSAVK